MKYSSIISRAHARTASRGTVSKSTGVPCTSCAAKRAAFLASKSARTVKQVSPSA